MEVFDSAAVELRRGISLIEASAGTGKTYAIAMLVLRLVTEQAIPIDRLLVVTFTKAATSELRERIRKRLAEARDLLRDPTGEADSTLRAWAAGLGDRLDRGLALERLALALCDIDCAAIFTIHGFCQRMLQEQAIESNQLFQVELVPDPALIREQVVQDFWRHNLYGLGPLPCALLLRQFPTPAALYETVRRVSGDISAIEPDCSSLAELVPRLEEVYRQLREWWSGNQADLLPCFQDGISGGYFKKELSEGFALWWRQLDDIFRGGRLVLPDLGWLGRPGLMGMLNGNKLRGDAKKQAYLQDWPLADALTADWQNLATEMHLALRAALAGELRSEVDKRLRGQGSMSYNDLILSLAAALGGPGGDRLLTVLGGRYAAALIDEFQDTDAAQWQIFSTLFGDGGHALYLIGDPKQAIYRFRGADIYSYFAARDRADRLLTLERNFRSHPLLVAAVNRLFSGDRPFAFPGDVMPYQPVAPARTAADGALYRQNRPLEPLLYCHLPAPEDENSGRWSSGRAAGRIREFVVREIGGLLGGEAPVQLRKDGVERPLRPRDIAILVRSNSHTADYQKALMQAGVPAVVASRQSVFATAECLDILRLLRAIHEPGDLLLQKAAMTCGWFGLDGRQLQEIWQDDEAFDRWHLRFQTYAQQWREQGFLTMMSSLLREEGVFLQLAGREMAERRISNIAHLLELIQEAVSADNLGPAQTLQWLQAMRTSREVPEEFELRLESDEEAVQVVTMHGAKGLEYPVVFCPYLWYRRNTIKSEKNLVTFHDADKKLRVDLGSADFAGRRQQAEQDELSEDLRLLYVAVTRARLRCYVIWADVRSQAAVEDSFNSALGLRLFPDGPVAEDEQVARLSALAVDDGVALQAIGDEDEAAPSVSAGREAVPLSCRQPSRRSLQTIWQMSSYSALASQSRHEEEEIGEGRERPVPAAPPGGEPIEAAGLPSGAHFGNVVHDLLETESFTTLAAGSDFTDRLEPLQRRNGLLLDPVKMDTLLRNAVRTPLQAGGAEGRNFTLAMLDKRRQLREMPFYFHLGRTATGRINEILSPDPAVVPLSHREMQGYLTGFVDLICEHDGRFYVVDYKTNNLGERQADYAPEALLEAMRAHNYGLQYWLYTLVLHRYLGNCLPEYDYDRHFGGVMYLFVRGMIPVMPGSGVFRARPDLACLQELDRCLGGGI
jgi:exodeoxyribonuclease V beta subunit